MAKTVIHLRKLSAIENFVNKHRKVVISKALPASWRAASDLSEQDLLDHWEHMFIKKKDDYLYLNDGDGNSIAFLPSNTVLENLHTTFALHNVRAIEFESFELEDVPSYMCYVLYVAYQ